MDPVVIGNRIRSMRGKDSQKDLADKLNISSSALAMYERGERIPRDEVKIRIAKHFNVSVEAIFLIRLSTKSAQCIILLSEKCPSWTQKGGVSHENTGHGRCVLGR